MLSKRNGLRQKRHLLGKGCGDMEQAVCTHSLDCLDGWLVVGSFTSLQHLRSCQYRHWLTCDSGHSWCLYSADPLENQAASTMTQYPDPTQSYYLDTEPTCPCSVLLMESVWWGTNKYQFHKLLVWLDWGPNSQSPAYEACILPIQPLRPVRIA